MSGNRRPEHNGPPELFYNDTEAKKYNSNSRVIEVQASMTDRALELLALSDDEPKFLLDLGCGTGLSGEVISDQGHFWVGMDISEDMLNLSRDRDDPGEVLHADMGQGVSFRPGTFDGAISISALQWLCHSNATGQNPVKRLTRLFTTLYSSLRRGSRAVFQFYPENPAQVELITQQATKAGFTGGLVVDFPNSSKAKKVFLVLFSGGSQTLPQAMGTETQNSVVNNNSRQRFGNRPKGKPAKKSREWVQARKDRARQQGKEVRADSKFTARKRKNAF